MKYRLLSDLHSEIWETYAKKAVRMVEKFALPPLPDDKETTLLLAGDIGNHRQRVALRGILEHLSERFKFILYIPGNHEYYGDSLMQADDNIVALCNGLKNVLYGSRIRHGRAVSGATLWTDFDNENPVSMWMASRMMNDYRRIKHIDNLQLTPEHILEQHKAHLVWLKTREASDIIMTHHAPSPQSIAPEYVNSELNGAYVSKLEELILEKKPKLWVHGHIHRSVDYMVGDTRVISNPFGYWGHDVNPDYNPTLVLEV